MSPAELAATIERADQQYETMAALVLDPRFRTPAVMGLQAQLATVEYLRALTHLLNSGAAR